MRILLVEDETEMAGMIATALVKHGIVVDHARTLAIAREALLLGVHDAVLLDRKLPDGDGLTLIPQAREMRNGIPVIVLSALGSLSNRLMGLDGGADDYLAKPFSIDELLARLRAVLRRPSGVAEQGLSVGLLAFDSNERSFSINGEPVVLRRRELLALELLIRRAGRVVGRQALEEAVFGYDDPITSNTLEVHISRLRKKVAPAQVEIHGIRGIGYLLKSII